MRTYDPLVSPPPAEVPLPNAPLVRVIARVSFPLLVSVEQRDFIAPFQKAIYDNYPILRQERTRRVVMSSGPGEPPFPPQTVWRFNDVNNRWRVSLTPDFLALETTSYKSRADFLKRLRVVVEALDENIRPKVMDRLGVRYVDRIVGDAVSDIASLVRPEVRGIAGTSAASHAIHTVSESMFELDGERLLARWGRLPAGVTVDSGAIESIDETSWVLDLDMFTAVQLPFSVDRVLGLTERFAERIYTFFRWAVEDAFLMRYGGKP